VRPGDERLYIGHLVCNQSNGVPLGITVHNEFDSLFPHFASLVGSAPVTPRMPTDEDVSPAAGAQPFVPHPAPATTRAADPQRPRLSGNVRLRLGAQELTPPEAAKALGVDSVELEAGGIATGLGVNGAFSLRLPAGPVRVDHLLLRGPGLDRRAVFFPARELELPSAGGCLGTLELTWSSPAAALADEPPASAGVASCASGPTLATRPGRDFPVPDTDEPLWVRAAISPFLGGGLFLGPSKSFGAFDFGARFHVFYRPGAGGSLFAVVRAALTTDLVQVLAGAEWSPGASWYGVGLLGGVASNPTVGLMPAVSLQGSSGFPRRQLSVTARLTAYATRSGVWFAGLSVGLEVAPVALLGRLF
jgi:hypothetical protein